MNSLHIRAVNVQGYLDWTANGYMNYTVYHACQMAAFSFAMYRYNNPLVDSRIDAIDKLTPSGV